MQQKEWSPTFRRRLAPPCAFEGTSVQVSPAAREGPYHGDRGLRRSEVGRAHAIGHSSHITDGGIMPPPVAGWTQPEATAGSSSSTMARRQAEGVQQLHFFSQPVWPAPANESPPRPFSGPHSLSARGRGDLSGHFPQGCSMEPRDSRELTPRGNRHACAAAAASAVKRQAAGFALVGSAVIPLHASGDGPPGSTPRMRGQSAAMRANFDGGAAKSLISGA